MDHVVRGGEVQAHAAGFEGDQEHVAVAGLERGDALHPRLRGGGAVQVLVGDAFAPQVLLHQLQVSDELREHQHLVPVGQEFRQGGGERGELRALDVATVCDLGQRAGGGVFPVQHQLRVAAGQAQPRQVGQHLHAPAALAQLRGLQAGRFQLLHGALAQRLVQARLGRRHLHVQDDLGALRQVVQHVRLEAPQHERRDEAGQARLGGGVAVALGGQLEVAAELLQRAEQARIHKGEQRVQIHQVVLDRRAGGDHPKVRVQAAHGAAALGGGVLHRLRLVQHGAVPPHLGQRLDVVLGHAVGGHEEVERAWIREQGGAGGRRADVLPHVQRGRETPRLVHPVRHHRGGRDHQRRALRRTVQQGGQGLHGLAEAHVVRQTRARPPAGEAGQPAVAVHLVGAQLRLQRARHGRLEGLRLGELRAQVKPPSVRLHLGVFEEVLQGQRGEGIEPHRALRTRRGQARQIVELPAERVREGDELAVLQLQEAGPGAGFEQAEQALQFHHPAVVDGERAGRLHPFRRGLHRDRQRGRGRVRDDAERLALRPLAAGVGVVQLLQQLEALPGFLQHQRRALGGRGGEQRTRADQSVHRLALGGEVALRLHALPVQVREHGDAARGRRETDAGTGDRLHQDGRGEAGVQGLQPHPRFRVRRHGQGGRGAAAVALHANVRGQRGHRVQQPRLGAGGQRQALLRDDLEQLDVRRGKARHLATPAGR